MDPSIPNRTNMNLTDRAIHDDLLVKCAPLVETAKRVWREKKDPGIVILWPGEVLQGVDGEKIEDEVLAELPREHRRERLLKLVEMTKAYGLLVIELYPHALIAIFESHHGTRSWTSRLELRGDVTLLAKTEEKDNADYLGLLWTPRRGSA